MKKLLLVFLSFFLIAAHANSPKLLTNYNELLNSISQGNTIRAIMLVNKCSVKKSSLATEDAIGGMNFTNFNKHPVSIDGVLKNTIATSITMLVEHSTFGPVYDYVRLQIFENNSAEIFSEFLDPRTYKQLGAMTLTCTLSNGHDQNGVLLYEV